VSPELVAPLKRALLNHGVDLMTTGGMLSSAHTDEDIERTVDAFRAAAEDLRAEGALH
jgi:glutamate-1-semialdehyde aminotransferase